MVKNVIKGSFPISKVLVFEGKKMKNVIKGSFPMLKVLVFEGNSYVCWKNEDISLFYDCKW